MKKNLSYMVFISPDMIPYVDSIGLFRIDTIENKPYIACSNIDLTGPLLLLTIRAHHLWNVLDNDFLIYLPYQAVACIISAPSENLDKIPGFHNNPKNKNIDTDLLSGS